MKFYFKIFIFLLFYVIIHFSIKLFSNSNSSLILLSFFSILYFVLFYLALSVNFYKQFSFAGVFLLSTILFHLFSLLFFIFFGNSFEIWPSKIDITNANNYVFESELYFILCTTSMIFGWSILKNTSSYNFSSFLLISNNNSIKLLLKSLFLFLFIIKPILFPNFRELAGQIDLLLNFFYIFLIIIFVLRNYNKIKLSNFIFYTIPLIYFSLMSGMKEFILLAIFPILLYLWLTNKNKYKRFFLSFIFIFIGFIITLIVSSTRLIKSENINNRINYLTIIKNIPIILSENESVIVPFIKKTLSRKNVLEQNARAFYFVENNIKVPEFGFAQSFMLLIPRFIWKNKPLSTPANYFAKMSSDDLSEDADTTGFFTALLLSTNYYFGIVQAFIFGLFISFLQYSIKKIKNNLGSLFFNLYLIYYAFRLDEQYPVEALPKLLAFFLFCFTFIFFNFNKINERNHTNH